MNVHILQRSTDYDTSVGVEKVNQRNCSCMYATIPNSNEVIFKEPPDIV